MKLSIVLLIAFLINLAKALSKPELLFVPREPLLNDELPSIKPKTIFISGISDKLSKERPHSVLEAVMNAVQNQFKQDLSNEFMKDNNNSNTDSMFSEPIKTDAQPGREVIPIFSSIRSPPDLFQKVYKFPAVTRMISREEEVDNNNKGVHSFKKNQMWRSPLPFLHDDCQHSHKQNNKKSKPMKKRVRKQQKASNPTQHESTLRTKPVPEVIKSDTNNESGREFSPLRSLLMSLITRSSEQESEEPKNDNEIKPPTAIIMSIRRRSEPEPEFPQSPFAPKLPILMNILHKKLMPEPELPIPPFNPFLTLFSKLIHKPIVPEIKQTEKTESEVKSGITKNYNFNFNLSNFTNVFINKPQEGNTAESVMPSLAVVKSIKRLL